MKSFLLLASSCCLLPFSSNSNPFSVTDLDSFYGEFVCNEKNTLAEAKLTDVCTSFGLGAFLDPPPPVFVPNPPQPPTSPIMGYLPIVIVNNSGLPDNEVFILLQGRVPIGGPQIFMSFAANGVGTQVPATVGTNGSTYSEPLSFFPTSGGNGHVFYIPMTDSFLVFISLQNKLNVPVVAAGIVDPAFDDPNDPNFNTIWDQFEGAYVSTTPNISVDATAVSFFSIPLYLYLSTPTPPSASNCGLTQSRSAILNYLSQVFAVVPPAPENAQWSKLVLRNGSTILRSLSTGKGIAGGYFDVNYLDNQPSYNYSYLANIWYSSVGFYQNNTLSIEIPGGATYSGRASGNTLVLNSGPNQVILGPVTQGPPYTSSTSFNIFSGINLTTSATIPADGIQVSKAFEEAIIAGIVPTTSLINASLLTTLSVFRPYYQINPNLSSLGQTSGPWYDLYSKALHACGLIYTFAFDEPLWPEVLLGSNTLQTNTYVGVTIGPTQ